MVFSAFPNQTLSELGFWWSSKWFTFIVASFFFSDKAASVLYEGVHLTFKTAIAGLRSSDNLTRTAKLITERNPGKPAKNTKWGTIEQISLSCALYIALYVLVKLLQYSVTDVANETMVL